MRSNPVLHEINLLPSKLATYKERTPKVVDWDQLLFGIKHMIVNNPAVVKTDMYRHVS